MLIPEQLCENRVFSLLYFIFLPFYQFFAPTSLDASWFSSRKACQKCNDLYGLTHSHFRKQNFTICVVYIRPTFVIYDAVEC